MTAWRARVRAWYRKQYPSTEEKHEALLKAGWRPETLYGEVYYFAPTPRPDLYPHVPFHRGYYRVRVAHNRLKAGWSW